MLGQSTIVTKIINTNSLAQLIWTISSHYIYSSDLNSSYLVSSYQFRSTFPCEHQVPSKTLFQNSFEYSPPKSSIYLGTICIRYQVSLHNFFLLISTLIVIFTSCKFSSVLILLFLSTPSIPPTNTSSKPPSIFFFDNFNLCLSKS